MEKEEILEVIEIQLQQMNETDGKSIRRRMGEMRTVVNLLAKLVLTQANVVKSCICPLFVCSNTGGKCDKCGEEQWQHNKMF